eukprot:m.16282 g.16282  ORF g.16282 m.16282 type:complete len:315 (+) comp10378_c0_seq1:515-1459(+)
MTHSRLASLQQDVGVLDPFVFPGGGSVNNFLWIGSSRVEAPLHFDTSDNAYIQIHGNKRFWMIAPEFHPCMFLFPASHASDRQSQVPWSPHLASSNATRSESQEQFSCFYNDIKQVYVADLYPGDVLVMPAHWFHFVEAVTESVSVNVWTLSTPAVKLESLFANAIPFYQSSWPTDRILLAVTAYVRQVIAAVECPPTAGEPGKPNVEHVDEHVKESACVNSFVSQLLKSSFKPLLPHGPGTPFPCSVSRGKGLREFLASYVGETAQVFLSLDRTIRALYLSVWTQFLAEFVAGSDGTASFLHACVCSDCHVFG